MAKRPVIGLERVKLAVDRNDEWIRDALHAALYEEGLAIDKASIKEVPVRHGRLKQSHYVAPISEGDRPKVEVGYGTDYAVFVHERVDLNHKSPTKAKYLQDPMERAKAGFASRLAKRTKRNWQAKRGLGSVKGQAPTRPVVTTGPTGGD
jgi:hypothetical protein